MMLFFIALIAVMRVILNAKTPMGTSIIADVTVSASPSLQTAVTLLAASIQTIPITVAFHNCMHYEGSISSSLIFREPQPGCQSSSWDGLGGGVVHVR